MAGPVTLEALDLAALLCSRVCHDLISPVGAVVNGLEVLEEGKDRPPLLESPAAATRKAER